MGRQLPAQKPDHSLRSKVEEIADQLCLAVDGQFDFTVRVETEDESIEKLQMLINFTLDAVRRALERAEREHQEALRSAEELRQAQTRVLLSENAASMGRLAAALSHELNSPLGAQLSALDVLQSLLRSDSAGGPMLPERMALRAELLQAAQVGAQRMRQVVERIQRFTNLDRAEVQQVDLNQLLSDVVAVAESHFEARVSVRLETEPLPRVLCRPQQLCAVFSKLLHNAFAAIDGSGQVRIVTRERRPYVDVVVEDNGRGLSPDQLKHVFDPGFTVADGRVGTGHWGLFSSRHIIHEHGGEICVDSLEGQGTQVYVALPTLALAPGELQRT